MEYTQHYASPLGGMLMASDGTALTGLWFDGQRYFARGLDSAKEEKALPVFEETSRWLDDYFRGEAHERMPPLRAGGTPFQMNVCALLRMIPYGKTVTYGELAAALERETGRTTSARAVGGAIGRNPISIIIPCHRVVGAAGALTGYAGGLERKARLLALEQEPLRPR